MRIWDIDPGFLNNQSLLGEHRELHGIHAIISKGKTGYSRHPETRRWVSRLPSLLIRHGLLVAEMKLRGFNHYSPLAGESNPPEWPPVFIDQPAAQYRVLQGKYLGKKQGRIPLPNNIQELWAAHKYSVMARDPAAAKKIGRQVAAAELTLEELAQQLVLLMRTAPGRGRLANAVAHMWGYIADYSQLNPQQATSSELLLEIQAKSGKHVVEYLLHSTALGELGFWADNPEGS
ncbi:MAG: DUF1722 domain-containing protein [Desulfobulbaceae bacterium]|nr:DUF1722 domain-containing protein [Desulfobulbaceae bacterium]